MLIILIACINRCNPRELNIIRSCHLAKKRTLCCLPCHPKTYRNSNPFRSPLSLMLWEHTKAGYITQSSNWNRKITCWIKAPKKTHLAVPCLVTVTVNVKLVLNPRISSAGLIVWRKFIILEM